MFAHERPLPLQFIRPSPQASLDIYQDRTPTWRVRTTFGDQTIPEIVDTQMRPLWAAAMLLNGILAIGLVAGGRAAGRRVRLAELKATFVASISHDLRTPLAQILLFAETLQLGRLKGAEQVREYSRTIHSEACKLNRLIENVLDFSTMEAGLMRYRPEVQNLVALTGDLLTSLQPRLREDQFVVTYRPASTPVRVTIDSTAATRALENVLLNAIKYSPTERVLVVEVLSAEGYGTIRVTDRGIGIPRALHKKIFQKFYRINNDGSSGPQGCGLGLAIVDHVMRAHKGFITVDSEVGAGTTFALHFPLCLGE